MIRGSGSHCEHGPGKPWNRTGEEVLLAEVTASAWTAQE